MNGDFYNSEYYERGVESGKSCYQNYRWVPELTIPMAMTMIDLLFIKRKDLILDYGCFVKGTKILLSDFTQKNIEEISKGDEVITHTGCKSKVVDFNSRLADKTFLLTLSHGVEIETTEEHPFLYQTREGISCLGGIHNTNGDGNYCSKCKKKPTTNLVFKKASEMSVGGFLCIQRNNKGTFLKKEDWAEFLGFYLAEGSVLYSHPPNVGGLEFNFHIKEEDYAKRVGELGLLLGGTSVTYIEKKDVNTRAVQVFGKKLAEEIIRLGGKKAAGKKIAPEVFKWDDDSLRKVVVSWLKGDGYRTCTAKNGLLWIGTSISYPLISGMRQILFRLGIMTTEAKRDYQRPEQKDAWDLRIHGYHNINRLSKEKNESSNSSIQNRIFDDYILLPIKKIEIKNKPSIVYNMEVEGDHSYIANNLCVHNCAKGYLVKAFRLLNRKAWGVDISDYALKCCPPDVKDYCKLVDESKPDFPNHYDLCIAKDVFEHIPIGHIGDVLKGIRAERMFAVIPLGDDDRFRAKANNYDQSHVLCKNENWWKSMFQVTGWYVNWMGFRVDGIKDSYYSTSPKAHGFFILNK